MKIPHDQFGDHRPIEANAVLVDYYELKGATLKFMGCDLGRTTFHVSWKDIATGKQYFTDAYELQAILGGGLSDQAKITFFEKGGLHVTANWGFKQRGRYILLVVVPPTDTSVMLDHAIGIISGYLAGTFRGHALKREATVFMKAINAGKEAGKL